MNLDEAALVDSASRFRIYWNIDILLAISSMMVVTLFIFMGKWNDFFYAADLFERQEEIYRSCWPAKPVGQRYFQVEYPSDCFGDCDHVLCTCVVV